MTAAVTDFGQYAGLRASAERNDPAALREVATQFEALFVQTLLSDMRGAQLAEPMFDSRQMEMYQGMFDQQVAVEMASGRGIGFAEMLVRQLGGEPASVPTSSRGYALAPVARADGAVGTVPGGHWDKPEDFVRDIWPHAQRAAARLGVEPRALVAQAALETGWGAHVMGPDAGSSHNLFGIKATGGWQGDSVRRNTLEYAGGVAERRSEPFRAYASIGESFDDYAELLATNPRYAAVRGAATADFGAALQQAGYATDPEYANKINSLLDSETMQRALGALKNPASAPITTGPAPSAGRSGP